MKKNIKILIAFGLLISIGGCGGNATSSLDGPLPIGNKVLEGKLVITGSSTVAPLVAEMATLFEKKHPRVRIDVQTGGSSKGIADARNGIADIGLTSRALVEDESDLTAFPIAVDGVGLIVHASNSISDLTSQQVIDIYTGDTSNWSGLNGAGSEITVVHKAEGRATLEVFLKHLATTNPEIRPDVIVGDNEHAVKTVANTEGAIGYVSIGTAEADIQVGVPIKLVSLDGVKPSTENVASGTFPMNRPLNLVTAKVPGNLAKTFIEFCQSEEVHDVIIAQYFVPLKN